MILTPMNFLSSRLLSLISVCEHAVDELTIDDLCC